MAATDLDPCNPIRLGLTLNLTVYFREIKDELPKAILLTEHALQAAVEKMDDIGEPQFSDTQTLIEIMNNNLSFWKTELEEQQQKKTNEANQEDRNFEELRMPAN